MSESGKTPRTDALLLEINEGRVYENDSPVADFARQLERELEEAKRTASVYLGIAGAAFHGTDPVRKIAAGCTGEYDSHQKAYAIWRDDWDAALAVNIAPLRERAEAAEKALAERTEGAPLTVLRELLTELDKLKGVPWLGEGLALSNAMTRASAFLQAAESRADSLAEGWIDVKERLPTLADVSGASKSHTEAAFTGFVLGFAPGELVDRAVAWRSDDDCGVVMRGRGEVTHWQPLPAAPSVSGGSKSNTAI